jgi:hypothetical protein
MRFNIGFTPGTDMKRALATIDKRLTMPSRASLKINAADKTRRVRNVVNRKPVSVYQTDAVLVFSVLRALEQALATAKQYRVRRCSKECLLRSSPARLALAPGFIRRTPSKQGLAPSLL